MADIDTIREALEELVRIRITETPYPFIRDIHSDNYYQGALKALAALERGEDSLQNTQLFMWCLIKVSGGKISIPRKLLLQCNKGSDAISRHETVDSIIFTAITEETPCK